MTKEILMSSKSITGWWEISDYINHFDINFAFRFLWEESEVDDSWEVQLAKRYYDKLFKEYCIIDLSR